MSECGIAKQIAEHACEPESDECAICYTSMTEGKCDNNECESNDE